jgi:hypothetical protein
LSARRFRPTPPWTAPVAAALLRRFLVPGRDNAVLLVRPVTSNGLAGIRTGAREPLAGSDTIEKVTAIQADMECVLALLIAVRRRPTGAVVGPPPGPPRHSCRSNTGVPLAGLALGLAGVGTHLPPVEREGSGSRSTGETAQHRRRDQVRPKLRTRRSNRSESTGPPSSSSWAPEGAHLPASD